MWRRVGKKPRISGYICTTTRCRPSWDVLVNTPGGEYLWKAICQHNNPLTNGWRTIWIAWRTMWKGTLYIENQPQRNPLSKARHSRIISRYWVGYAVWHTLSSPLEWPACEVTVVSLSTKLSSVWSFELIRGRTWAHCVGTSLGGFSLHFCFSTFALFVCSLTIRHANKQYYYSDLVWSLWHYLLGGPVPRGTMLCYRITESTNNGCSGYMSEVIFKNYT